MFEFEIFICLIEKQKQSIYKMKNEWITYRFIDELIFPFFFFEIFEDFLDFKNICKKINELFFELYEQTVY